MTQLHQSIIKIYVLISCLTGVATAQDFTKEILDRLAQGETIRVEDVTPTDRPQVILAIKNFLKNNHEVGSQQDAVRVLVALRDDDTIRDLIGQYHSDYSKGRVALELSANSEIIPFVAVDLSLPKETGRKAVGDVYIPPTRVWAAHLIFSCIVKSPEFPTKTRAWAGSFSGTEDEFWSAAKDWWTHNQDAIKAKHYSDATWLP